MSSKVFTSIATDYRLVILAKGVRIYTLGDSVVVCCIDMGDQAVFLGHGPKADVGPLCAALLPYLGAQSAVLASFDVHAEVARQLPNHRVEIGALDASLAVANHHGVARLEVYRALREESLDAVHQAYLSGVGVEVSPLATDLAYARAEVVLLKIACIVTPTALASVLAACLRRLNASSDATIKDIQAWIAGGALQGEVAVAPYATFAAQDAVPDSVRNTVKRICAWIVGQPGYLAAPDEEATHDKPSVHSNRTLKRAKDDEPGRQQDAPADMTLSVAMAYLCQRWGDFQLLFDAHVQWYKDENVKLPGAYEMTVKWLDGDGAELSKFFDIGRAKFVIELLEYLDIKGPTSLHSDMYNLPQFVSLLGIQYDQQYSCECTNSAFTSRRQGLVHSIIDRSDKDGDIQADLDAQVVHLDEENPGQCTHDTQYQTVVDQPRAVLAESRDGLAALTGYDLQGLAHDKDRYSPTDDSQAMRLGLYTSTGALTLPPRPKGKQVATKRSVTFGAPTSGVYKAAPVIKFTPSVPNAPVNIQAFRFQPPSASQQALKRTVADLCNGIKQAATCVVDRKGKRSGANKQQAQSAFRLQMDEFNAQPDMFMRAVGLIKSKGLAHTKVFDFTRAASTMADQYELVGSWKLGDTVVELESAIPLYGVPDDVAAQADHAALQTALKRDRAYSDAVMAGVAQAVKWKTSARALMSVGPLFDLHICTKDKWDEALDSQIAVNPALVHADPPCVVGWFKVRGQPDDAYGAIRYDQQGQTVDYVMLDAAYQDDAAAAIDAFAQKIWPGVPFVKAEWLGHDKVQRPRDHARAVALALESFFASPGATIPAPALKHVTMPQAERIDLCILHVFYEMSQIRLCFLRDLLKDDPLIKIGSGGKQPKW